MAALRKVEILYFDGCPHTELARARASEAIASTAVAAELSLVVVGDEDDATRHRFTGSPTIRVDGRDVEQDEGGRTVGLQCRVYSVEGRLDGAPPVSWIEDALRSAVQEPACCGTARTKSSVAIACRPDALSAEERSRSQLLRTELSVLIDETRETVDGYAFRYRTESGVLEKAAAWITLERRCCPFLAFTLEWAGGDDRGPCLSITGPDGTKAFLAAAMPELPRER